MRVEEYEYLEHSLHRCRTVIGLGRLATHPRYPPAHFVGDHLVDIRRDGRAAVCYPLGRPTDIAHSASANEYFIAS